MEQLIYNHLALMSIPALILVLAVMLYILTKGADILVNQAVSLSVRLGIPKMIIGATIVSLGTTLPEATISVMAAIKGNPSLALGNAIGSIIADTGLIIGLAAIIGQLPIEKKLINRHGNIQLGAGILLAIVCLPFFSQGNTGNIKQWMGWLFLILLAIYIYVSLKWAGNSESYATAEIISRKEKTSPLLSLFKLFGGILLVIGSSKIIIPVVETGAFRIGIPEGIIAATLIAFGTSLPELTTAITAVRQGHGSIAVGNVIGADILNVLFVVGTSAAVTKEGLHVPFEFYRIQIPAMLILLIAFRIFASSNKKVFSKKEGLFLVGIYFLYLILNYI